MAYTLRDVFYLSTSADITKATSGGGSAQLDLSAYIDPIARGRSKGTGLAVYKAHWSMINTDTSKIAIPDDGEAGIVTMSLQSGLGVGDNDTGAFTVQDEAGIYSNTNQLMVSGAYWYGPASYPGANAQITSFVDPSTEVPYVIVRDNVCLIYNVDAAKTLSDNVQISVRLECAQVTLDQATLNQLLRTQTV